MRIAGDVDYDASGDGYAKQRCADPRIAARVIDALGNARTVLNVGAGAGSYEPTDRFVLAVEPSRAMRAQRAAHAALAIDAIAENLPLDDGSVDAAMAIITIHQWKNVRMGLLEMLRVTRGPVVILTFDGPALERYWLFDYIPELITVERARYMSLDDLRGILEPPGRSVKISNIPIPVDCSDGIIEAFYARPEKFLDDAVRRAQSSWGFVDNDAERHFVRKLREDLESGAWERRFGALRETASYDGSLRLIVSSSV